VTGQWLRRDNSVTIADEIGKNGRVFPRAVMTWKGNYSVTAKSMSRV
jgi:hypothetical protein